MNFNSREIPVSATTDVLVVGGGIAGIASAIAAARHGADVMLVEKTVSPGGLATIGNVIVYLPLCDGVGNQVSAGIAEELLLLAADGSSAKTPGVRAKLGGVPECWRRDSTLAERSAARYEVEFNAATYLLTLEEFLLDEGVKLRYDTRCIDVEKHANRISTIVIADKSGISRIAAKTVIDATGDADICVWAGEAIESHATNVACGWHYVSRNEMISLVRASNPFAPNPSELPEGVDGFACESGVDVTNQVLASRKLIRDSLARQESETHAISIPSMATFRMTRRLRYAGETDSIAASKQTTSDTIGIIGDWRKPGPAYSIRYAALHGTTANLLVAGRCIAVSNDLWDVTRAIPACAVTGQAAGTAAAMSVYDGCDPIELEPTKIRSALANGNVILELPQ